MSITHYLNAAYPLVFVSTYDESRLFAELERSGRRRFVYAADQNLFELPNRSEPAGAGGYAEIFRHVAQLSGVVLIVQDMQSVIRNPAVYRALLSVADDCKANGSTIVAVAPHWELPAELQHAAPVVSQALPGSAELAEPLRRIMEAAEIAEPSAELSAELCRAACGLTVDEAENAFALSLVEARELSPSIVNREKMRQIESSGFLHVEASAPLESVGGLGQFKRYLEAELLPVINDDLLHVRGFVLAGLPGGGKSLGAKATAAVARYPLVRLDPAALRGSLVGETEKNARQATALIEAVAPCVLWIDEADKSLGSSSTLDGGASAGAFGHLLNWLQEHKRPITTVITCNDYHALPSELTRAGRFDERFFVDLPTESERQEIAAVHLARFGCAVALASDIAKRSKDLTGAEIEQLIKSAARLSGRDIKPEHLEAASATIRPVSKTASKRVQQFRQWARSNMRPANDSELASAAPLRKLAV